MNYLVSLIKSKQNDKYCWKESQLEADLSNSNKTVQFEQIGFKLRIHLQTSNKVILVSVITCAVGTVDINVFIFILANKSIKRK